MADVDVCGIWAGEDDLRAIRRPAWNTSTAAGQFDWARAVRVDCPHLGAATTVAVQYQLGAVRTEPGVTMEGTVAKRGREWNLGRACAVGVDDPEGRVRTAPHEHQLATVGTPVGVRITTTGRRHHQLVLTCAVSVDDPEGT